MKATKGIMIELMYRDGSNYKSHGEDYFTNDNNIPLEDILEVLEPFIDNDGIMVQDYYINSIAPMDNEFLPTYTDDHSFCEITGVEEIETESWANLGVVFSQLVDISKVIEAVNNGGNGDEVRRLNEARLTLNNTLNSL